MGLLFIKVDHKEDSKGTLPHPLDQGLCSPPYPAVDQRNLRDNILTSWRDLCK